VGDRTVKAILKADVSSLVAGMKSAQKATKDFAADAKDSAGKNKAAWESTGKGMMVAGGVIAAGIGLAVKTFADFDAAMSAAQAGTMATGASLDALRAAAIDAGAKTQYSATEAAQAITAMGKAGVSTKDILGGGLTGALSLAAAGQLDVGAAAEIAATAMNQFGLEGKDIPHIADLLAAGAGKAMGSVEDLGGALKFVGPVAKGLGVSIEETTGTLAMFAQAGIKGEMGGTALRGVLLTLTSPSAIVAKRMAELGVNVYGADGKFIGLKGAAGELQAKLGPLDDATRNAALGQIFGNEQVTAARILYDGGAVAVDKWTKSTNDAGYAARQAAMLTDNLKGDIERLGGSLSSVLIQAGSGANGMLRTMTQELQGAVDLYGSLPAPVQTGATALAAVAAAAFLSAGGLLVLAPRIVATKAALADMGKTGALLSGGLSKAATAGKMLGGPLVLATVALGYFAQQAQESKARVDELATSLDQETGALTENTAATVNKKLSDDGSLASARSMGVAAGDLTAAYLGNTDAAKRVDAALKAYGLTLAGNADISAQMDAMNKLKATYHSGNAEVDAAVAKTRLLAEANAAAIDPTTGLSGAQKASTEAAKDATNKAAALADAQTALAAEATKAKDAIDAEVQALQSAGLVVLSTREAVRQFKQAQVDATDAIKKNGTSLDVNTQKGRDNAGVLDKVASSALGLADSIYKQTGSEEKMRGSLIASRASLVETAMKFGMTKAQANAYADSIIKIPASKLTKAEIATAAAAAKITALKAQINAIRQGRVPGVDANTAAGKAKIAALQRQINALTAHPFNVNVHTTYTGTAPGQGHQAAAGGYIRGPGTTTSDSIPSLLSDKEYVVKAKAVDYYGVDTMHAINSMRFAAGGYVGSRSSSSAAAPSLVGVAIEGTLDIGGGLIGVMRGVVKSELAETGAKARYAGVS